MTLLARSALLLLLVAALALAGCTRQEPEISANEQVPAEDRTEAPATAGEGTEEPGVPTWVAVDIAFDAAPSEIPAGGTPVQLVNEGAIQHNVVIDDLGRDPILLADPGETVEGTLTLEPGEYRYHCSIPGHEQLMNGTVTVSS